jgi:ribosomal protein S18 acetylase RimI-like enzyme
VTGGVTYVGPDTLADLFAAIDSTHFHPHPLTAAEARRIQAHTGRDLYVATGFAYGMLRGWDEGYAVPSLGVAVRRDAYGQGHGRAMMAWLHELAREHGATEVRLRVHPDNVRAIRLYESLGYVDAGEERGERLMLVSL